MVIDQGIGRVKERRGINPGEGGQRLLHFREANKRTTAAASSTSPELGACRGDHSRSMPGHLVGSFSPDVAIQC